MRPNYFRIVALWALIAYLTVIACNARTQVGSVGRPTVTIQSPTNGTVFYPGEQVAIQSASKDDVGIVRVELSVDGALVQTDSPPGSQPQTYFPLLQRWTATAGSHTITVRAYNSAKMASDPAMITITVTASNATAPLSSPTASTPVATPEATFTVSSSLRLEQTVTLVPLPLGSATPTRRPVTRTATPKLVPTATPIKAPPGIYAVSLRVDPPRPWRWLQPTFYLTIMNSTGTPAYYRWFLKIYRPDVANSMGETFKKDDLVVPGTNEYAVSGWQVSGPGTCETFYARVFWVDLDSKQTNEFLRPGMNSSPTVNFEVCP